MAQMPECSYAFSTVSQTLELLVEVRQTVEFQMLDEDLFISAGIWSKVWGAGWSILTDLIFIVYFVALLYTTYNVKGYTNSCFK